MKTNKLFNKIKDGFAFSLGIFIFFGIVFGVYAVGFHPANEILSGNFLGNYIFNGSVNFNKQVNLNSTLIRTIAYNTSNGPMDGLDVGQIVTRVLTFNKTQVSTKIRILYADDFRNQGVAGGACRWEIKIDGTSCPQPLINDYYSANGIDLHLPNTLTGYCSGISTGMRQIQVFVGPISGYPQGDCYTGFNSATWVLEAEEVN